jgi:isocitrate dehydrogenase (NAD+)
MMLRHLQEQEAANRLGSAVRAVYAKGEKLTRDVGGKCGTAEFTDAVVREIQKQK